MSIDYPYSFSSHQGYPEPEPTVEYDDDPDHHNPIDPVNHDPNSGGGEWSNAAALNRRLWPDDKMFLLVQFLDGFSSDKDKVKALVEKHYNTLHMRIKFIFLEDGDATPSDIRVSFDADGVSKSFIGCDAEYHPNVSTMTLNMHREGRTSKEDRHKRRQFDVLHEFGHALGMEHEHTHPDCAIDWNYRNVKGRQGWDDEAIARNYRKLSTPRTVRNAYDPKSIMHYPVARGDTRSRSLVIPMNTVLSEGDKEFLTGIYPVSESYISSPQPSKRSAPGKKTTKPDSHRHRRGRRGDEQQERKMYRQEVPYTMEGAGVDPSDYGAGHQPPYGYVADYGLYAQDAGSAAMGGGQDMLATGYDYQLYDGEAGPSEWQGQYGQ